MRIATYTECALRNGNEGLRSESTNLCIPFAEHASVIYIGTSHNHYPIVNYEELQRDRLMRGWERWNGVKRQSKPYHEHRSDPKQVSHRDHPNSLRNRNKSNPLDWLGLWYASGIAPETMIHLYHWDWEESRVKSKEGRCGNGKSLNTPADGFVLVVHHSEGATGADVITFGMHWDDNDRFEDFPTMRCQDNSI